MRRCFKPFLTETVTIERLSIVSDDAGGQTETWADVLDGTSVKQVKCRIYRTRDLPRMIRTDKGILLPEAYRMVCDNDAGILTNDRIVRDNNDRYQVLSIYAANTSKGCHHYEISLRKPT